MRNRSMPASVVIPVLCYDDVERATAWLCGAFGFSLRWRLGSHRAQLHVDGGGCVVVAEAAAPSPGETTVRVLDADAHHARAAGFGARVVTPPTDHPYGERQYGRSIARAIAGPFRNRSPTSIRRTGGAVVGTVPLTRG